MHHRLYRQLINTARTLQRNKGLDTIRIEDLLFRRGHNVKDYDEGQLVDMAIVVSEAVGVYAAIVVPLSSTKTTYKYRKGHEEARYTELSQVSVEKVTPKV
ncbi:MAG: hypothetical protein V1944_02770 [Candidatus Aenigmatarchaeota archaeon]